MGFTSDLRSPEHTPRGGERTHGIKGGRCTYLRLRLTNGSVGNQSDPTNELISGAYAGVSTCLPERIRSHRESSPEARFEFALVANAPEAVEHVLRALGNDFESGMARLLSLPAWAFLAHRGPLDTSFL